MSRSRLVLATAILCLPLAACEVGDFLDPDFDPDAPTHLTYELVPSGTPGAPAGVTLRWEAPASGRAISYDVLGRSSGQADYVLRATTTSPSFHDAGWPQYQYYVVARDGQGDEIGESEPVTIVVQSALPAPQRLTSISLDRGVHLEWAHNVVAASPGNFDYYRVYSARASGAQGSCSDWMLEGTTGSDAFLVTGLTNGVTRCYAVSAVAVNGSESSWSAVRLDTPRYEARSVAIFARDARPENAGFAFYDEAARVVGVVTSASQPGIDLTVERHADGTLWLVPARNGVLLAVYGNTPVSDLTAIDRAVPSALANVSAEAVPGFAYIVGTPHSDGMHYGALRVAYVAASYIVVDWSWQSAPNNPELSRLTPMAF